MTEQLLDEQDDLATDCYADRVERTIAGTGVSFSCKPLGVRDALQLRKVLRTMSDGADDGTEVLLEAFEAYCDPQPREAFERITLTEFMAEVVYFLALDRRAADHPVRIVVTAPPTTPTNESP